MKPNTLAELKADKLYWELYPDGKTYRVVEVVEHWRGGLATYIIGSDEIGAPLTEDDVLKGRFLGPLRVPKV